jgi:hypothetical protein
MSHPHDPATHSAFPADPALEDPASADPALAYSGPPAAYAGLATTSAEPDEAYAAWWRRVVAVFLDTFLQLPFAVVAIIALVSVSSPHAGTATQLGGLLVSLIADLGAVVFSVWNNIVRQGRHGASIGKQCVGIVVISTADARPIGAIMTFVRQIAHIVDYLPLGIGYLWPIWDRQKQTFADKLMNTVVLHLPGVRF